MKKSAKFAPVVLGIALAGLYGVNQAQNLIIVNPNQGEPDCSVSLDPGSTVNLDGNGDITVDVDDAALEECFEGGVAPIDVTLGVDSNNINSGEDVTVNWEVTGFQQGVTTCDAIGGTPEWVNDVANNTEIGSGTYTLSSNTTFTLDCQNAGDTESQAITVQGGGTTGDGFDLPPGCPQPPANRELPFTVDNSGNVTSNNRNFEDAFGPWGETTDQLDIRIPPNRYVALPFRVPDSPAFDNRFWSITWEDSVGNGDVTNVTIAGCPGDFSPTIDPSCRRETGIAGSSITTVVGTATNACELTRGGVYYLNVRHATQAGENECNTFAGFCVFFATARRL